MSSVVDLINILTYIYTNFGENNWRLWAVTSNSRNPVLFCPLDLRTGIWLVEKYDISEERNKDHTTEELLQLNAVL